jgi:hypothetical protein
MYHINVIITDFFVSGIVRPMTEFVRFNCQYSIAYKFAMVNSPTVCTIAVTSIKWHIVNKSVKICVDVVSYHYFFGMRIYDFASRIAWKYLFEASSTISVVFGAAIPTVYPCNAIWTTVASSMSSAFVSRV